MMRWPGRRNAELTLDYLTGMTHRQCGEKHRVHETRSHQIVTFTLRCLDLDGRNPMAVPAQEVGLRLRRVMSQQASRGDTPEEFYWEQERELNWRNHGV
jgi:hypothetical protein